MKLSFISFFLLFIFSQSLSAQQDARLAQHYYTSGEYEKAALIFKKLSEQTTYNDYYFGQYIECLMVMDAYDEAIESIKSTLKQFPEMTNLYITYGNLLERMGKKEEAEEQFRLAIARCQNNINQVGAVGNAFMRLTKYEYALEAFLVGERLLGNSGQFAYSIAEIYRRQNDIENMVHWYLSSPFASSEQIGEVQNYFTKSFSSEKDYEILLMKLYEKAQSAPENIFYPEMIQWVFITNKQYSKALRQAKALDMRLEENGSRIVSIAQIAMNDQDYDTAIDAYDFILKTKDISSPFFIDSKRSLLDAKRRKMISSLDYSQEDVQMLKLEYDTFLNETGRNNRTALMMLEMAQLQALFLNDLDGAISTLNELILFSGLNNYIRANAKLDLGDYNLMNGEIWESTLLYSQVDKEFREDHLGEMARYKNAKLSYYTGNFDWAQEQFNILKAATSKLISNDAIDLSVFIMDNANLDTSYVPLALYAQAELSLFQNKTKEAFQKLDSLEQLFPEHTLKDDIYYLRAQTLQRVKRYDEAASYYAQIIKEFPEELRADNAIFALAELKEQIFEKMDEAKELYELLFTKYPDSTFSVDARKRYRLLRGDAIQ